jgi:hypothetical protein
VAGIALLPARRGNSGDLRSLQPESSHQTFLAEEKCVDVFLKGGCRQRLSHAGEDFALALLIILQRVHMRISECRPCRPEKAVTVL